VTTAPVVRAAGAGPQAAPLRAEEFRALRALLGEHCGLTFPEDLAYLVEGRLAPRLARLGLPDFAAYHRYLREHPARAAELEAAVEALATHETYFWREPRQLRAFAEELLPALAEQNAARRRLRVWSAGCSTGEEAYTIAALLVRSRLFEGWDVEVFGSDIVRGAVAAARAGAYGPRALRTAEAERMRPWLREEGGRWHVQGPLRELVRFGQQNLLDPLQPGLAGLVDVIFCRNVLIYFDLPARRRVVEAFRARLRPGGYLLLGHSESLLRSASGFELAQLRDDLVYRKPRLAP
jgi:chemotaxis protein methyltransferase CheR